MSDHQEQLIEIRDHLEKVSSLIDQMGADPNLVKAEQMPEPLIDQAGVVVGWMMVIIFFACLISGMMAGKEQAIGYSVIFVALFIMIRAGDASNLAKAEYYRSMGRYEAFSSLILKASEKD